MGKYFRENNEYTGASYLVNYEITVSSDREMQITAYDADESSTNYLDRYDEKTGRWVCKLGVGFRDRRLADYTMGEDTATIDKFYKKMDGCTTVRESFLSGYTYYYDHDIFSCSYEIAEYTRSRRRNARFRVEHVSMRKLEEIEEALRAWHATGELVVEGVFIELGDWQESKNAKFANVMKSSPPPEDYEIPFAD